MQTQEQMVSLRDILELIHTQMVTVCEECDKLIPADNEEFDPEERAEGKLLYQRLDALMMLENEMKRKYLINRGN